MKIIDNKKVDMTDDEWNLYIQICRSYDRASFKGEELFRNLFESDANGMIIFLRPPSDRHTSMEAVIFMLNLMAHQHMRSMHVEVADVCNQMKAKINEIDEKLKTLNTTSE